MSFPLEPDGPLSPDVAPPQFGVDGQQAERDWPLMTHDEVAALLSRIDGAGEPARLTWHSPRQFAAATLVRMTDGRALFVKRHHVSLRDVAGLEEEHRFIAHLRARGMPVVNVLADRNGAT
ncbi:MAG: aminoglycoside phosphotransferase family protein, partial [Burkholderia ambifaria]